MFDTLLFFLFDFLATIFGSLFVLRYWLQRQRVQPTAEVVHLLRQLTRLWVDLCTRILPGRHQPATNSAFAAFLFAFVVSLVNAWNAHQSFDIIVMVSVAILLLLKWWVWSLMLCILVFSLASWIAPGAPQAYWIGQVVAPLLNPLRSFIKPFGRFDPVPLLTFVVLNLGLSVITYSIDRLLHTQG